MKETSGPTEEPQLYSRLGLNLHVLFLWRSQVLSHNLCTVMRIPHDPVALEEHFKDNDEGPVSNQGYMPYLNRFILDKVAAHTTPDVHRTRSARHTCTTPHVHSIRAPPHTCTTHARFETGGNFVLWRCS